MEKLISRVAYIYIALPFIIFALGFTKWFIGIPVTAICIWGLFCMWKDADSFEIKPKDSKDRMILLLALLITIVWVILSGIGGVTWQNSDHLWRNATFKILVDYDWPPVNSEGRGLTYYIGFWLPSALVGKLFGLQAGFSFQIIWAVTGIYLVYLYICEYFKKISILPFVIFIFFSGLDIIGAHIPDLFTHSFSSIPFYLQIETWAGVYVYVFSSHTTQLFWVFNQCIYSWLALMIILKSKTNKYTIFIMGLMFISSVFGFMGLIPVLAYYMFTKKNLFSLQNIICGGVSGILTFIYYLGNNSSQANSTMITTASTAAGSGSNLSIFLYVAFVVLEALIYVALVFKYNIKNPLFYIMTVWLLICPLVKFGMSIDFCMRASIPCLLLLTLYVIDALYKSFKEPGRILTLLIIMTLIIGSVTTFHEISRTILMTVSDQPHYFGTESNIFDESNFSCDADSTFFFKYIGK